MAKTKKPVKSARKKPVLKKKPVKKQKSAVKKAPAKKPLRAKRPSGMPETLRDAALKILDDRQAEDIVTVDLTGRSSLADYLIIASGRAARQIAAMAHYLKEAFAKHGIKQIRMEGLPQADWVLVDAGDVIVHLFRPEVRRYYDMDSIWNATEKDIKRSALLIE